jgi:serine/threonine protein kinase
MAPEVVTESFYTENVDVWSLGITLIEMMDRVPPLYYLENTVEIYQEILYGKQPSFHFTTPSTALQNLLDWMLNPDGHHRPMAKDVLQVKEKEAYPPLCYTDPLPLFCNRTWINSSPKVI